MKALLVDDEELARENLRMLLEDYCPNITVVGTSGNVEDALEKINTLNPDVVFLDIRMPSGAEGFDLLERTKNRDFQVVFVTAFKDFAIRAFNANAIHYILKPIDIEDLRMAVEKLENYHASFQTDPENRTIYSHSIDQLIQAVQNPILQPKLTLFHTKGFRIVDQKDILRLEAEGNCTRLYFADGTKYLDTKTLKVFESLLDEKAFMRVHKSHIINLEFLSEYSSQQGHLALMKDRSEVPVARGRLSLFLNRVKSL